MKTFLSTRLIKTLRTFVFIVIFFLSGFVFTKLYANEINFNSSHTSTELINHYGSGFMLTLVPYSSPQNLIADLKIKFYRTQLPEIKEDYTRVKAMGAQVQFLIYAEYFGANFANGVWPGDNENWDPWEETVRNAVNFKLQNRYDVEYEIWNEPDFNEFWQRDQARFFETWKRAYKIIKEMDPTARIAGPSTSYYNFQYLKDFLSFAKQNNVVPNTLVWHELNPDEGARYISQRAAEIRGWIASNSISTDRIIINEIVKDRNMYKPAHLLSFFTELERNKIYGAHACWFDYLHGENNCFNSTLTGVVTIDRKPRSLWWLYKYYADMTGQIKYLDGYSNITGFSATDNNTHTTRFLIGALNSSQNVNLNFTSEWLNSLTDHKRELQVNIYLMNDSTGREFQENRASDLVLEYSGATAIQIPQLNSEDVAYVVVHEAAFKNTQNNITEEDTELNSSNELPGEISDEEGSVAGEVKESQTVSTEGHRKKDYLVKSIFLMIIYTFFGSILIIYAAFGRRIYRKIKRINLKNFRFDLKKQ
jgi:hypothetical protein